MVFLTVFFCGLVLDIRRVLPCYVPMIADGYGSGDEEWSRTTSRKEIYEGFNFAIKEGMVALSRA
jgi:hypothetical protein